MTAQSWAADQDYAALNRLSDERPVVFGVSVLSTTAVVTAPYVNGGVKTGQAAEQNQGTFGARMGPPRGRSHERRGVGDRSNLPAGLMPVATGFVIDKAGFSLGATLFAVALAAIAILGGLTVARALATE